MDFKLTREQKHLKKDIIRFAQETLCGSSGDERNSEALFSRTLWAKCGELRIPGLIVPEAFGGLQYDAEQFVLALQGLGYGCENDGLLIALAAHLAGCQVPLTRYGSEALQEKYLRSLADGAWIGASAMIPSDLKDLAGLPDAVRDGNDFVIHAEDLPFFNSEEAEVFVIYAVTDRSVEPDRGVTCFVLEKDAPGVKIGPATGQDGIHAAPAGRLSLAAVRVTGEDVVGKFGQGASILRDVVAWLRTALAALQIGRMDNLLETTIKHARTRQTSGPPIGKNQSVSHAVADMKIRLEVARLLNYKAAWQLDQEGSAAKEASISKLFASESAMQSSLEAVQIFGRSGFLDDAGIGRKVNQALSNLILAGSPAQHRSEIAREMNLVSPEKLRVLNVE